MPGFAFNPDPDRTQVWSCGGGTQSCAIAALIVQGRLPKPEVAVIVDTEREKSSTWEYYESVLKSQLELVGVDLVRVQKSKYATVDLWRNDDILLPVYTDMEGVGKLPAYCSGEWKRDVIQRYCRDLGVKAMDNWIGYSCDEMKRVSVQRKIWIRPQYPLIELGLRRSDCIRLVEEMGWPTPPRSSCWMCPNMRDEEWSELKNDYPEDFQMAIDLEREIRERDENAYFHKQMVPLSDVKWSTPDSNDVPFWGCESGMCWM